MDGRFTIGRTDGRTVGQTNRQMNRQTDVTDWQPDRRVILPTDKQIHIIDMMEGLTGERKDKSMHGQVDGHLFFAYYDFDGRLQVQFKSFLPIITTQIRTTARLAFICMRAHKQVVTKSYSKDSQRRETIYNCRAALPCIC